MNLVEVLAKAQGMLDRRDEFIAANKCIPPPIGCSGEAMTFINEESAREYAITGMCQSCQDRFYGDEQEPDICPVHFVVKVGGVCRECSPITTGAVK